MSFLNLLRSAYISFWSASTHQSQKSVNNVPNHHHFTQVNPWCKFQFHTRSRRFDTIKGYSPSTRTILQKFYSQRVKYYKEFLVFCGPLLNFKPHPVSCLVKIHRIDISPNIYPFCSSFFEGSKNIRNVNI